MRRSWTSAAIACLALTCATAEAEPIKLTIAPAKPPVPALRYQLLPEVRDRTSGNAMVRYYRAYSPEYKYILSLEYQQKVDDWLAMPMAEFKDAQREEMPASKNDVLRELDLGARRSHCDWELIERVREDGLGMLLPDVQGFRSLGKVLSVRARREIVEGKFYQAVYTLQTSLQMARHVSEGPTLIHSLVAIAMVQETLPRIEDLMEADGPNLYWALSNLPTPFIDMRQNFEAERLFLDAALPRLRERTRDLKSGPMTEEEAYKLLDGLKWLRPLEQDDWRIARADLVKAAEKIHPEASKYLIQQGRERDVVAKMPIVQVALMYAVEEYDRLYDEMLKWQFLPFAERQEKLGATQELVEKLKKDREEKGGIPLAEFVLPAITKVGAAQVHIDRRIAALRTIEAIRLHAAENKGKPPKTLADIKAVPVPNDPVTGKAFAYKVDGKKITLEALAPEGEDASPTNTLKYEIMFRAGE